MLIRNRIGESTRKVMSYWMEIIYKKKLTKIILFLLKNITVRIFSLKLQILHQIIEIQLEYYSMLKIKIYNANQKRTAPQNRVIAAQRAISIFPL
jgi:hypothetical protein